MGQHGSIRLRCAKMIFASSPIHGIHGDKSPIFSDVLVWQVWFSKDPSPHRQSPAGAGARAGAAGAAWKWLIERKRETDLYLVVSCHILSYLCILEATFTFKWGTYLIRFDNDQCEKNMFWRMCPIWPIFKWHWTRTSLDSTWTIHISMYSWCLWFCIFVGFWGGKWNVYILLLLLAEQPHELCHIRNRTQQPNVYLSAGKRNIYCPVRWDPMRSHDIQCCFQARNPCCWVANDLPAAGVSIRISIIIFRGTESCLLQSKRTSPK